MERLERLVRVFFCEGNGGFTYQDLKIHAV